MPHRCKPTRKKPSLRLGYITAQFVDEEALRVTATVGRLSPMTLGLSSHHSRAALGSLSPALDGAVVKHGAAVN